MSRIPTRCGRETTPFATAATILRHSTALQQRIALPWREIRIYPSFTKKMKVGEETNMLVITRTFEFMMVSAAFFIVSAVVVGIL